LIVIAEAEGSRAGNRGFSWQTVRVTETLRGRSLTEGRPRLDILQRLTDTFELVPGESYLLVLRRPEWQITCPAQTLARVRGDQLEPFKGSSPRAWLANGSLAGLRRDLAGTGNRRP
jgi:hypothetical protein